MTKPVLLGSGIFIAPDAELGADVRVGHASCIGFPDVEGRGPTVLGDGVTIGAFCVIERGARLGAGVALDHYCRVGTGSSIGAFSKLLYGAQIFEKATIGERCIIGGNVDDRVVIEDDVTYMGAMAHSYRTAGTIEEWDTVVQPSPVIRRGSVIGQNALLVGGIEIGEGAYIAAGEVVRTDIPAAHVLFRGEITRISDWRGVIKARDFPKENGK